MAKSLIDALNSIGDKLLVEYWEGTHNDQIKQDIKTLMSVSGHLPNGLQEQPPQLTKLESFTMAAMQGLCANSDLSGWVAKEKDDLVPECAIATIALRIARATFTELSKQQ